ncbi:MAG: methyltransferase domain-containing protein [Defluviitaleaceae bacterium]|nr:methyltransferase domain-containing protein [Defluviitaleaceae bacterium]
MRNLSVVPISNAMDSVIDGNSSIADRIFHLPCGGIEQKGVDSLDGLLFVVNETSQLIGTLTASDFHQLDNVLSVNMKVKNIMNKNFKFVTSENSESQAVSIFDAHSGIHAVPVVDEEGRMVSVICKASDYKFTVPFSNADIESVFAGYKLLNTWHHRGYLRNWGATLPARRFVLESIINKCDVNSKILDVACGTGLMSFYLAAAGFTNLYGFDIDENLINAGKNLSDIKGYNVDFQIDDAFLPSCDISSFDVVIMLGWVFANFDGKNTPIDEVANSLFSTSYKIKTGAYVFLDLYDDLSNFNVYKEAAHFPTVKYEDLKPVFEKHGFKLVDKCYDCSTDVKVIYLLKKT